MDEPPGWRIKPFTQRFLNAINGAQVEVIKLERKLNIKAHYLANRAFRHPLCSTEQFAVTCNNPDHASSCNLKIALQNVTSALYGPIAAVCC